MKKIIFLENIRSMQNVGAIFRNADGAGFEKVILTGYTPYPPRRDISKTALGAENWIDWEFYEDKIEILNKLKKNGYKIFAVELTNDAVEYTKLFEEKDEKVVLVMGNEVAGVSQEILYLADKTIIIPMKGRKESLNVSVAAGIVMFAV